MIILSVAALVLATLFAGAALYITLVEHPARLTLPDGPMLAQWRPSYKRALPIQAALAVLGGVAGIVAWYGVRDWRLLAGGLVLLANWPWTMLVIMPVNKRLTAMSEGRRGRRAGGCWSSGAGCTRCGAGLGRGRWCCSLGRWRGRGGKIDIVSPDFALQCRNVGPEAGARTAFAEKVVCVPTFPALAAAASTSVSAARNARFGSRLKIS
jgi:hypothetical protein